MSEDNEWEVRVPHPSHCSGQEPHGTGLEASGRQQHRLSVSQASSEGGERNGGNVIRLGEDSVRE